MISFPHNVHDSKKCDGHRMFEIDQRKNWDINHDKLQTKVQFGYFNYRAKNSFKLSWKEFEVDAEDCAEDYGEHGEEDYELELDDNNSEKWSDDKGARQVS